MDGFNPGKGLHLTTKFLTCSPIKLDFPTHLQQKKKKKKTLPIKKTQKPGLSISLLSFTFPLFSHTINMSNTKTEEKLRELMEEYHKVGSSNLPNVPISFDDPEHEHRNLTQVLSFFLLCLKPYPFKNLLFFLSYFFYF